jgi:hypothetical protein
LKKENGPHQLQRTLALLNRHVRAPYVNLSEIDDAMFAVSEEDKELNRKFYGESQ